MRSVAFPCLALALLLGTACGGNPSVGSGDDLGPGGEEDSGVGAGGDNGGPGIEVDAGLGGQPSTEEAVCGNGALEDGELCDDGNTEDDDGCSGDCSTQDVTYDCSIPGEKCKNLVVCGNGQLEGDEACDDGDTESNDGCSADCSEVEVGFVCPRPGKECVSLPVCGNGERERGEECDDGQLPAADEDGCSATCRIETGYWCPVPGEQCVELLCGDGVRTPDEECDDGPGLAEDGDGCSASCEVEGGWHCSAAGCSKICGDGVVLPGEACDDGDRDSGDGCSAACKIEPFFECDNEPGEKSVCDSAIECGDLRVDPGEICDPPGLDGCLPGCKSFSPDVGGGTDCGNKVIEAGEECDPPMPGSGCTAGCLAEDGWSCPRPEKCFPIPRCGDGILQRALGELCDDGDDDPNDGCSSCKVVAPYSCYGLQPSVCVKEVCGDGVRTPSEECDDGANGAGCTDCQLDDGWACPVDGEKCFERCGDGKKVGSEECDDSNSANDDGCNAGCRIEVGYTCPDEGEDCIPGECGNGEVEEGEGCDDSNEIAGDGCGPTCQKEPTITPGPNPTVAVLCGDGLITSGEVCDDGNALSGDGCSADCKALEPEFACEDKVFYPPAVDIKVTYRDFKQRGSAGGHPDFQWGISQNLGIPGPVCTRSSTECTAAAGDLCPAGSCGHLDAEGKPAFHLGAGSSNITDKDSFALWYRDTNAGGLVGQSGAIEIDAIESFVTLTQVGDEDSDVYEYDDSAFWPLTDIGFGNDGNDKNFHFTTELRYFFQYKGGETLTFRGDDDVWVFVNGRHAVDIGGVHGAEWGRVVLGDDGDPAIPTDGDAGADAGPGVPAATDSDCSVHHGGGLGDCALEEAEKLSNDDVRFGLEKGKVYEITLFQAERHTTESNFRLTLAGFLAPRTFCKPNCGDGKVAQGEVCDDGAAGNVDGVSGKCNSTCTARAFCGDDEVQTGETCDNGRNLDLYSMGGSDECAPGCVLPPRCGDSVVQPAEEACDNGAGNDDSSYGLDSCTSECKLGGFCGDAHTDPTETCDLGAQNGVSYGPSSCGYDCKPGPKCGDGIRNGSEECDGSAKCRSDCTLEPYCGDGVVSAGEDCDFGQFHSDDYGGCDAECHWASHCGDGTPDTDYEECDLGEGNTGSYDGCTETCTAGPHCGDGVLQSDHDEACDNGFNEDDYAYTSNACGPSCTAVPYCGDGTVESGIELCDDGEDNSDTAYNGCSASCEWGPYCGDGVKDPEEGCDKGLENTWYSADGLGCGYDCEVAPYCGDGVRNGPEQCDLGTKKNKGAYGSCNADCTRAPYCGDGKVQNKEGEECDAGPTGSLECTALCKSRSTVK